MARLWLIGHAVQYLGLVAQVGLADSQLRYVVFAGAALQALAVVGGRMWRGQRAPLAWALIGWLVVCGVVGALSRTWISYYLCDVVAFSAVLGYFAALPGNLERLGRLYTWMLPLGLAVAAYRMGDLGAVQVMGERFVGVDAEEANPLAVGDLCMPAAFVMLTGRDRLARYASAAGLAALVVLGLITSTRGIVVLAGLTVVLRLALARDRGRWAVVFAAVTAAVLVVASSRWSLAELEQSASVLGERFDYDDVSTGRNEEAAIFLDQTDDLELAFGRGLGGSYFGLFIASATYGINIVHYGYLHLVLKGGIALLALFALVFARALTRWRTAPGCAAYLLVFVAANVVHTQFLVQPSFAFAMLAAGACSRRAA